VARWEPWLDRLLSTWGVVAFWVIYCLFHIVLRVVMSSALSLDDARANETAQTLALGYQVRQPPLYSWLLWAVQQVVGTGLTSHLVLRYSLVALIGIATYGATLAASNDRRWSAVASLSLVFTYSVGWTFQEWATETLLLSIACLVTFQAAVGFLGRPDWRSATFLGLAVGLGLMSKLSYPLFLFALVFAATSLPEARRRLADLRLIYSVALALLLLSPFIWWLVSVHGDLAGTASAHLVQSERSHLLRALIGLGRLAWSLPAFLLPWLAVVVALAWPAFVRSSKPMSPPLIPEQMALRTMVIAAVLMAAGIAAIGATNIAERYMHPALMIAPVYVFTRIARYVPAEPSMRRFVVAVLAGALILVPVRILSFENEIFGRPTRPHAAPYAGLAKALSEKGHIDGTFVTMSVRVAGNLRQFLPDGRYLAQDSFLALHPPRRASDERSCVFVWTETEDRNARRFMPIDATAVELIEITEPSVLGRTRRGLWFVARLDPRAAVCS
jgi:hypothetical protein